MNPVTPGTSWHVIRQGKRKVSPRMAPSDSEYNQGKYPYLGRTSDYVEFNVIEPGLVIAGIETWTRGRYGVVRVTTADGREGYGQLSPFEPDISATVLHRQLARHVLGSDPA